jgi:hypothetical protein
MATEAAWLKGRKAWKEEKQTQQCALTSTGLLIEGI